MDKPIKYRPSNGTEGMIFCDQFCVNCIHGKYEHTGDTNDNPCDILTRTFFLDLNDKDYPDEWQYDANGHPTCTAFVNWNWDKDDDGNWIDPPAPDDGGDPNQLMLFSIADDVLQNHQPEKSQPHETSI